MRFGKKWSAPRRSVGFSGKTGEDTHKDVYQMDELAKFLGIPEFTDVVEHNQEYLGDYYQAGWNEAWDPELPVEEAEAAAEEAALEAEREAEEELYFKYSGALEAAAESILDPHGLAAEHPGKILWAYKIVPTGTWKEAAAKLVQTINGVGMFYYEDAKDLKDVGPYKSYKQAVLSHLHWAMYYPEVYGTRSAEMVYDAAWR